MIRRRNEHVHSAENRLENNDRDGNGTKLDDLRIASSPKLCGKLHVRPFSRNLDGAHEYLLSLSTSSILFPLLAGKSSLRDRPVDMIWTHN